METVKIPTPLKKFTGDQSAIETNGGTVLESIADLAVQFPDLKNQLFDPSGALRSFVRIYVGEEDINALQKEQTPVAPDTVISIIPAIAGGAN